ncbi:radical SAM protein [Verrucomicrobiota bacterium]
MHGLNNQNKPVVIAWETTRRCTLRCQHCRGAALDCDYAGEFSTGEFYRTIDNIASFAKPMLILTGGEPMMRDDIYDIARYATDKGLRVVMAPCGHLITQETAAKLKASGVMAISISIDGATKASHDAFRGVPGAFKRTMEGLQHAINAGIPFQVNTTVTRQNIDDIPAIYEKAVELGAKTFDLFFLVPTGRGSDLKDLEISSEQAEELLHWVVETNRTSPIRVKTTCAPHVVRVKNEMGEESQDGGCMGGKGFVFISHTGILQPCGFFDVPCGDLRAADYDFKTLYETSPVFNDLRDFSKYKGKCGACEFVALCSGCRARALSATGDYLDAEPTCGYQPE